MGVPSAQGQAPSCRVLMFEKLRVQRHRRVHVAVSSRLTVCCSNIAQLRPSHSNKIERAGEGTQYEDHDDMRRNATQPEGRRVIEIYFLLRSRRGLWHGSIFMTVSGPAAKGSKETVICGTQDTAEALHCRWTMVVGLAVSSAEGRTLLPMTSLRVDRLLFRN